MRYISHLDYLSHEAKLTFNQNGETKYHTVLGGILSSISILGSFVISLILFIQFVNRKTSYVAISSESSECYNFSTSNTYPFIVRLSNINLKPFDNPDKLYEIKLKFWYFNNKSEQELFEEIEVEKCNLNKHFGIYEEIFKKISDIDTYYCPIVRNSNQTIFGIYKNNKPFSYYQFSLFTCTNKTSKAQCYNSTFIENSLQTTYLDLRYVDFDINNFPGNISKKSSLRMENFLFSLTQYKKIIMYLTHVKYIIDTGLVFTSNKEENFFQVHKTKLDVINQNDNQLTDHNPFGGIVIAGHSKGDIYSIKFAKIQELVANISGMIKLIHTSFYLFNFFYSQNSYYFMIMNHFFNNFKKTGKLSIRPIVTIRDRNSLVNTFVMNNYVDPNKSVDTKTETSNIKQKEKKTETIPNKIKKGKKTIKNNQFLNIFPFTIAIYKNKKKLLLTKYFHEINKRLSIFSILSYQDEVNLLVKRNYRGSANFELWSNFDTIVSGMEKVKESKNNSYISKKMNTSRDKINS